jgi:hypothetical protein
MQKIILVVTVFIGVVVSLFRLVLGRGTIAQSGEGDGQESSGSSYGLSSDGGDDGGDGGD